MKMFQRICIALLITTFSAQAQFPGFSDPDSILVGTKKLPKVLLVGTWHFSYPGMDAHKSEKEDQINILSERRQKELVELLEYIEQFQPTKIAVESGPITGYLKWRRDQWKEGKRPLGTSELEQIGIRLMDRLKLDTIYGVNASSLLSDLDDDRMRPSDNVYIEEISDRHYFGGDDPISQKYNAFYSYSDRMTVSHTLLESFKYFNSDKVLDRDFGAYIAGGQFDSENYEGADALSMLWFNRNLRIFRNIQRIDHTEEDRIIVLFGAGHIAILKYLFECTPQFELVDFNHIMKD